MTPGVLHVHVWPSYLFIVFLLLKKSSQELYTVSVESMPQYTGGGGGSRCCKGGRVGKDLLCGVLIALAVICAAVAIFLVAFYVVNGSLFHFFFLNDHQEKFIISFFYTHRNWGGEDARWNGSSERNDAARLFTFDTKPRCFTFWRKFFPPLN